MTKAHNNRRIRVLLGLALAFVAFTAQAVQATGEWRQLDQGIWVKTNSAGTVEEIRADIDDDPYTDVKILTNSSGSLEWLGIDRTGGPSFDTWYYRYTSGAVYVYLDGDGNGTFELHGYDASADNHFEWVRVDSDGDGHADKWFQWAAPSSVVMTYTGSNDSTATLTTTDMAATYGMNLGFLRSAGNSMPSGNPAAADVVGWFSQNFG